MFSLFLRFGLYDRSYLLEPIQGKKDFFLRLETNLRLLFSYYSQVIDLLVVYYKKNLHYQL